MYRDFGLQAWAVVGKKHPVDVVRDIDMKTEMETGLFFFLLVVLRCAWWLSLDLFDPWFLIFPFLDNEKCRRRRFDRNFKSKKKGPKQQHILPLALASKAAFIDWILSCFHYKWVSCWRSFLCGWVPVGVKWDEMGMAQNDWPSKMDKQGNLNMTRLSVICCVLFLILAGAKKFQKVYQTSKFCLFWEQSNRFYASHMKYEQKTG